MHEVALIFMFPNVSKIRKGNRDTCTIFLSLSNKYHRSIDPSTQVDTHVENVSSVLQKLEKFHTRSRKMQVSLKDLIPNEFYFLRIAKQCKRFSWMKILNCFQNTFCQTKSDPRVDGASVVHFNNKYHFLYTENIENRLFQSFPRISVIFEFNLLVHRSQYIRFTTKPLP